MKALLIEVVHAAWGFELRPGFLQRLHQTLKRYDAVLAVDEILTAGRTPSSFLYTQSLGEQTRRLAAARAAPHRRPSHAACHTPPPTHTLHNNRNLPRVHLSRQVHPWWHGPRAK